MTSDNKSAVCWGSFVLFWQIFATCSHFIPVKNRQSVLSWLMERSDEAEVIKVKTTDCLD